MTLTTISDFRANIRTYVDSVLSGCEPVIINRGNTGAVLISLDEYNSIKATEKVLGGNIADKDILASIDREENAECIEVNIDDL